jgi:4-amino-4-deoxy-L-arabinose transferase-like glycosyltransferase
MRALRRLRLGAPSALTVFALALAVRAGYVILADPPLLFNHQYNYYTNALAVAEQEEPLRYVVTTDRWRAWVGSTTIAPLYYLVLATFFRVFGPGIVLLRLFQATLDSLVAAGVAGLGRRLAGPGGTWAGVLYALWWSAIDSICWTMTENLHTLLLVGSFLILVREAAAPRGLLGFAGGLVLGLSGLTRSVSSAFVPVATLWRLSVGGLTRAGLRCALRPALLLGAGGLTVILAWSARNTLLLRNKTAIETVGYYNLWHDSSLGVVSPERFDRQLATLYAQPTGSEFGKKALAFARRNIARNPLGYLRKIEANFWHLVRPEGLNNLLSKEFPDAAWRNGAVVIFDDLLLLLTIPPFVAFLIAGPPSPTRRLLVIWTGYYLFFIVVVFHSEARYRSALLPFAFAGAVALKASLRQPRTRRRVVAAVGLLVGALVSIGAVGDYVPRARRALIARRTVQAAREAVARGDLGAAQRGVAAAAAVDPTAARPWHLYGRWLAAAGRPTEAVAAHRQALQAPGAFPWLSTAVLPALLRDAGLAAEADTALRAAHEMSFDVDPWLMLEAAWRELPPPRTDVVRLGGFDYGAVRGFHHPRGTGIEAEWRRRGWATYIAPGSAQPGPPGPHRWSRRRAWIRLRPTQTADRYAVTIAMGSPLPSPQAHPQVCVRVGADPPARLILDPEIREYRFEASAPSDGTLVVRLDAPAWGRAGEPADQAIRVDWLRVSETARASPKP